MARQRFKGQTCAYCAHEGVSEAPDHIFARGFFPVEERDRLPQVPACRACNQEKAALEHYLLTVLPFGGESAASTKVLSEAVPGRLAKNLKLHRNLSAGRQDVRVRRGDDVLPSFAIPIEGEKLFALFSFIARGLATYHWGLIIPASHAARAGMFTRFAEPVIRELFCKRSGAYARGALGADTILYEGVQAIDDPYLTIWRFRIYGGTVLTGYLKISTESASDIWATTSRAEVGSLFNFDQLDDASDQRTA